MQDSGTSFNDLPDKLADGQTGIWVDSITSRKPVERLEGFDQAIGAALRAACAKQDFERGFKLRGSNGVERFGKAFMEPVGSIGPGPLQVRQLTLAGDIIASTGSRACSRTKSACAPTSMP